MLTSLPLKFTEDTDFERISVLFETILIAPQDGRYNFYVLLARNTKLDFKINGGLILSMSNSIRCDLFYNNTQCWNDTTFEVSDGVTYKSGDPLLLQL